MGILSKKISSIILAFTMIIGISTGLIINMPMTAQASNAPSVYISGDSFIGTDGNEMSAAKAKQWSYEISDDGKSIRLERYKGTFSSDGYINSSVPSTINGLPVTSMEYCFYQCEGLVVGPDIPDTVTLMHYTFFGSGLVEPPIIPNGVTDLNYTFGYCYKLVNPPLIPDSVTRMDDTFSECKNLTIAPVLPSKLYNMSFTFAHCYKLKAAPEIPSGVAYLMGTFWGCDNIK